MADPTPPPGTPAQLCGYVYAHTSPPISTLEEQQPHLVWTGSVLDIDAVVGNYSQWPWVVDDSGTYDCSGSPPPYPPVVNPPGTGGGGGDSNPPVDGNPPIDGGGGGGGGGSGGGPITVPPPVVLPIGGGGGDGSDGNDTDSLLLTGILAELVLILNQLKVCCPGGNGGSKADQEKCCAALASAISAVALAMQNIATAVSSSTSAGGAPPDLTAIVNALGGIGFAIVSFQPLADAVMAYLLKPPAGSGPIDLSAIVKQLTRQADTAEQFNTNSTATKEMLDLMVSTGLVDADMGQLLGDPAIYRIDPARIHPLIRKLLSSKPEDRAEAVTWLLTVLGQLLKSVGIDVTAQLAQLATDPAGALTGIWNTVKGTGQTVLSAFAPILEPIPRTILDQVEATLAGIGDITPDNAVDAGFQVLGSAFLQGQVLHILSALAGYIGYPMSSLFGFNAAAAVALTGYEEITKNLQEAFYESAFGHSAKLHFESKYKPYYPREGDAVRWHARRLLSDAQLDDIFKVSGLKSAYEQPFINAAYVPVSARALSSAFVDVNIPTAEITSMMQAAGYRDADISTLLDIFNQRSTQNVRAQYLAALTSAAEAGDMTTDQLDAGLTSLDFSDDAKGFVHLTVATKRLQQLTTLYRKSISEGYKYGSVTDADYLTQLEAIGINSADAQAHYAIDSITKHGKEAAAAARAEATAEAKQQRAAVAAAQAQFRAGNIDALALGAELAAAGLPAAIVVYAVATATARQNGAQRLVYGQLLAPADAEVLRGQVAAIGEQVYKKLLAPADAIAQLANLKVPGNIREALVAKFAAAAGLPILPA